MRETKTQRSIWETINLPIWFAVIVALAFALERYGATQALSTGAW